MKEFVVTDWKEQLEEFVAIRISTGGAEYCVDWDGFREKYGKDVASQLNGTGDVVDTLNALGVPTGYVCSLDPLFPEVK